MFPIWPLVKALFPTIGLLLLFFVLRIVYEFVHDRYFYKEKQVQSFSKKPTVEAIKLKEELVKLGYNAELEKWDGHKHIDIAVVHAKVNIEVDGTYHNYRPVAALQDLKRTFYSLEKGYVTVRIPNSLVRYKLPETVGYIDKILRMRIAENSRSEYVVSQLA